MKKQILLLTLFLISQIVAFSQDPFEKYGYKPRIYTLSNGKYQEFFDNEDVVRIGSALFNTQTNKIVGYIEEDTSIYKKLEAEIASRWLSLDPKLEEYPSWTPYNYVANNPINAIDPNGEDVYLIIWTTGDGQFGHAAIAVDNYKTVEVKDKDGNTVMDKNGNPVTRQEKDGTLTYTDLWPSGTVTGDKEGAQKDFPAHYQQKTVTMNDIMNTDVSGQEEGVKPNGVIQLKTNYETDNQVKADLKEYRDDNKQYNAVDNNCSDYARVGVDRAIGVQSSYAAQERFLYKSYTTPNRLFSWAKWVTSVNPKQGNVKKDPGVKLNTTFVGAAKRGE